MGRLPSKPLHPVITTPSSNLNMKKLIDETLDGLSHKEIDMIQSIDLKVNGVSLEKFKKMIKVKRIY